MSDSKTPARIGINPAHAGPNSTVVILRPYGSEKAMGKKEGSRGKQALDYANSLTAKGSRVVSLGALEGGTGTLLATGDYRREDLRWDGSPTRNGGQIIAVFGPEGPPASLRESLGIKPEPEPKPVTPTPTSK